MKINRICVQTVSRCHKPRPNNRWDPSVLETEIARSAFMVLEEAHDKFIGRTARAWIAEKYERIQAVVVQVKCEPNKLWEQQFELKADKLSPEWSKQIMRFAYVSVFFIFLRTSVARFLFNYTTDYYPLLVTRSSNKIFPDSAKYSMLEITMVT